jgi:hypothetical protein
VSCTARVTVWCTARVTVWCTVWVTVWCTVWAAWLVVPAVALEPTHPFPLFVADYHKRAAMLIDADDSVVWQTEIKDIHDAQPLADGSWLLQTDFQHVVEVDRSGKIVWRYNAPEGVGPVEIHSFRRLDEGVTMIAESGLGRIVEVDRNRGAILHSIPLKLDHPDPHRDTRLVRPTEQDTYLVAHEGDQCVREYDRSGKVLWQHDVGSRLYAASRLANGNTLIGTGDGHRVIEVNAKGEVVWSIEEEELAGIQLAWVTMVERLPNGNTWVVNCHCKEGTPQVFEVDTDKKVVWQWNDWKRCGDALPVAVPALSKLP